MICPVCKCEVVVVDEVVCSCGYFFKVKSREVYKWESNARNLLSGDL